MRFTSIFTALLLIAAVVRVSAQTDTTVFAYAKPLFDFDQRKPIFKLSNEQLANKSRFLRFSALTGYREGVEPIKGYANFIAIPDAKTGTKRFCIFNVSIQDMLSHGFYKSNRVILEVKDPSKYRYDPKYGTEQEWLRRNGYCFEYCVPASAVNGVKTLDEELARVFGVKFGNQKRMVDALVLIRTSGIDKIRSKEIGEGSYDLQGNFNNKTISNNRFGDALNLAGMPPVVDETGYTDPVDMQLDIKDWTDLQTVRKALQRYDLDLKQEKREVEMFIITENDWKPAVQSYK